MSLWGDADGKDLPIIIPLRCFGYNRWTPNEGVYAVVWLFCEAIQITPEQTIFSLVLTERSPWTIETELQALSYMRKTTRCLMCSHGNHLKLLGLYHVPLHLPVGSTVILTVNKNKIPWALYASWNPLFFWKPNSEHFNKHALVSLTEPKVILALKSPVWKLIDSKQGTETSLPIK